MSEEWLLQVTILFCRTEVKVFQPKSPILILKWQNIYSGSVTNPYILPPCFCHHLRRQPQLHLGYFLTDYLSIKQCGQTLSFLLKGGTHFIWCVYFHSFLSACIRLHGSRFLIGKGCQPPGVENNKSPSLSCQPNMNHYYVISISSRAVTQTFLWRIHGWRLEAKVGNFPVHYVSWVFALLLSLGVFTSAVLAVARLRLLALICISSRTSQNGHPSLLNVLPAPD